MTTEEQVALMERLVKDRGEQISKYNELNKLSSFLKGKCIIQVGFRGNSSDSNFRCEYTGDLIKESVLLHIKEQIDELSRQIKGTITV